MLNTAACWRWKLKGNAEKWSLNFCLSQLENVYIFDIAWYCAKTSVAERYNLSHRHSIFLNPLSPITNLHILLTSLHIFFLKHVGRICLNIKTFRLWCSFSSFSWPVYLTMQWYCKEKLDTRHCWGLADVVRYNRSWQTTKINSGGKHWC